MPYLLVTPKISKMILLILSTFIGINHLHSQEIVRQNIGCFSSVDFKTGVLLRQSIGQSSSTDVISNGQYTVRQGFQQPLFFKQIENLENKFPVVVFPNPFKEIFTIQIDDLKSPILVRVIDQNGKFIFQSILEDNQPFVLNTEGWSSGIYILIVNGDQHTSFYKLIKN